jgi:hypothetical protein
LYKDPKEEEEEEEYTIFACPMLKMCNSSCKYRNIDIITSMISIYSG